MQMLSNLIITTQRTILIIDQCCGEERNAERYFRQFLREQAQDESSIKLLKLDKSLEDANALNAFIQNELKADIRNSATGDGNGDCDGYGDGDGGDGDKKTWNVLLPTLSSLLCYQNPGRIFEFLHELRRCDEVKRVLLWASIPHIMHPAVSFIISGCEYLSDTVVTLKNNQKLQILLRKPGGGVTNRLYDFRIDKNGFVVSQTTASSLKNKTNQSKVDSSADAHQQPNAGGTFKIELEEEELVARNALKLPYEKNTESKNESSGGQIVYTPDTNDDFDEEDPDEDLTI